MTGAVGIVFPMTRPESSLPPVLADLVLGFDHVALAVRDLSAAAGFLRMLGGEFLRGGDNPRGGFRWVQFLFGEPGEPKKSKIEALAPVAEDCFLWNFLNRRGEGVHHLTFRVSSVAEAARRAEEANLKVTGLRLAGEPDGWSECFLHPATAHGVVVQLAQWGELLLPECSLEDVLAGRIITDN